MPEFQPPCFTGECPKFSTEQQQDELNRTVCAEMFKFFAEQGKVGFLEVNPCGIAATFDTAGYDGAELKVNQLIQEKAGVLTGGEL